jgi:hypothetical protein
VERLAASVGVAPPFCLLCWGVRFGKVPALKNSPAIKIGGPSAAAGPPEPRRRRAGATRYNPPVFWRAYGQQHNKMHKKAHAAAVPG